MNYARLFFFVFAAMILSSCTSDDGGGPDESGFDRSALLENWADNIIIPSFENFVVYTNDLEEKTDAFVEEPSEASLAELREAYEEAYIQFQTVSLYEIGRAEVIGYRMFLNTYPLDISGLQEKIAVGNYNLLLPRDDDEQGFPALDFLLNGLAEEDADILEHYTTHDNAATYRSYLQDVSHRINELTQQVLEDWHGDYRDTFVVNTASSSTGSVDRFTNDYIMYYEKYLRSGKIGYPAGAFTGNPVPQNVEARFSGDLSKELYLKALETVENFFNGKHFDSSGTGPSYKQYLDYLNSVKNSADLSSMINAQFDAINQQASNLNPNFVEQIETNNSVMLQAYDELQKNVVLLKVDMLQALSVSVDYVDSDGD